MNVFRFLIPATVTALLLGSSAQAQNALQNWASNELNKINQNASGGLLNSSQAASLQARDAQIQQQEQNYMNQNGGTLTSGEQKQIGRELRGLNRATNHDVRANNPGLMNSYNPYYANQYNNGYMNPAYQQWRNSGMGYGAFGYTPAVNPVTGLPMQAVPPMGTNYNGYPYRHHHHNGWGQ